MWKMQLLDLSQCGVTNAYESARMKSKQAMEIVEAKLEEGHPGSCIFFLSPADELDQMSMKMK